MPFADFLFLRLWTLSLSFSSSEGPLQDRSASLPMGAAALNPSRIEQDQIDQRRKQGVRYAQNNQSAWR